MSDRRPEEALIRRVIAAIAAAGVSREAVEFEWPECHKPKCARGHGSVDAAMGHMKHAVIDAVVGEMRAEATTRPDVDELGDSPEDVATITLAVLLRTYNVRDASTFANAARLMIEAYPALVPALAGVEP